MACARRRTDGVPDNTLGRLTMTTRTILRMCSTLLAVSLLATPSASAQLLGPSAPTNLAATPSAPGEITLTWEPASSLTGVTGYRVYHVAADGSLAHIVDVPADRLDVTEAGFEPGTTVTYVVAALDLLGEGPASEPATATTWTTPDAPHGLLATSGPGPLGETTITWNAPDHDGGTPILAYHVHRDGALVATLDAMTHAWTDTGLQPLQAYTYTITATNAVGESPASDPACGMASPWATELGCPGFS